MSDPIFIVGDVVQLNSDGPKLTVAKIQGERLTVGWFGDGVDLMLTVLPAAMFKKVENDDPDVV
jgi:hypothetical protein